MTGDAVIGRPRLKPPPGAVDTHMHIYDRRFATAPTALSTPPDAPLADYRKVRERLGLARTVIVQPTTYGTDNACTLEALAELGDSARAVVVVDRQLGDDELARLTGLGVRGIRFHMLPGGALPWDILEEMAARTHAFGWHVQLQLDGRELPERAALLKRLPGTLVVDHVGRFMGPVAVDDPAFKVLAGLLDGGKCWVKLSAPYESSKADAPGYGDVGVLAKALVGAAPERMLWASNWPHPGQDPRPDDAVMLDLLLDWAGGEATQNRILADNPVALYGF